MPRENGTSCITYVLICRKHKSNNEDSGNFCRIYSSTYLLLEDEYDFKIIDKSRGLLLNRF